MSTSEPKPFTTKTNGTHGAGRAERKRSPAELSKLLDRLPPHAIEAEMGVLGSMLIDPQAIGDVVLVLRSGTDFFKPAHGAIHDAIVDLYDKNSSIDIVQLNQVLQDRDVLESVGGTNYLIELANAVPTAAHATHYARIVREKAMIRELIHATGEILATAYEQSDDARSVLEDAEQRIFRIAQQSEQSQIESLHDLIKATMETLEANEGKQLIGVPTGFSELDEITTGLQKGEMIILAARPSMGKTAFALNLTENVAMRGYGVGFFSLEMGRQQLVQRLLASRSGIDSQRLRRNMLQPDDFRALMAACDELLDAPIFIDDTPGLSLMQLRAKARRMAQKHTLGMIVIDYLQLMTSGRRAESRQIEVSEISRGVKAMARELNVPVICLSQLNRAAEQREGHRPRMSDLRESGSIEQDADVVSMLHREEYYHQNDEEWNEEMERYAIQGETYKDMRGVAELIIAKQRNGPTGTVKLTWIEASTAFKDYTAARPPAGMDHTGGYHRAPSPPHSHPSPGEGGPIPFNPGKGSGPVSGFRDGGGPDSDDDDDDHLPD